MLPSWHKWTPTGALSEIFATVVVQMDGDGSVCGKFRERRRRLLGGRLEEEGGEVVGGGAAEIGGDGLGRKEGLYVSGIVAEADHLDGQLFGGGVEKEIAGEIEAVDEAVVYAKIGFDVAAGQLGLAAEIGFVGVTIDEIPGGELLVGLLPDLGDLLGGKGHLAVTCGEDLLERGLKLVKGLELWEVLLQIRHTALDRGYSLGLHLRGRSVEHLDKSVKVNVIHQCAMDDLLTVGDTAGIAGDLSSFHEYVVAACQLGGYAKTAQSVHHWLRGRILADDRVVHVLEIVIDGSATGHPAGQRDAVRIEIVQIHLAVGILVQAYDHCRAVPPEEEVRFLGRNVLKTVLVEREIEVRISGVVNQVFHDELLV